MALDEFLLSILVCPESKTKVHLADSAMIERINARIESGSLLNVGGKVVSEKVDGLLVREDGKRAYAIREDIPIMLIEEGFDV